MNKKIFIYIFILFTLYLSPKNIYAQESNELLKDLILNNVIGEYSSENTNDGLYYINHNNDKIYLYAGNVKNNNISFNSLKFNILGIDINGNIKIMYNDNDLKATSKNYLEVLNNWYKEKFENSQMNNIIVKTEICDTLSKGLFCENYDSVDIALITLQEFNNTIINNKTYLNKEYNYYFWTTYYNHKYYFNTVDDDIDTTKNEEFNIYPVLTLRSNTIVSSGNGNLESPFIIANTIYVDSENTIKEYRIEKLKNPRIIKKDEFDLLIKDNNLNSITYQINNNLYSIRFMKENMKSIQEFNLEILFDKIDNKIYDNIDNILDDKKYKAFNVVNTNEFPNTAITSIRVDDIFNDEDIVWLYYYNEELEEIEYADNNIIVEDGYITINLNKGGQYIITNNEINDLNNNNSNIIIYTLLIGGLLVIFVIGFIILYKVNHKIDNN